MLAPVIPLLAQAAPWPLETSWQSNLLSFALIAYLAVAFWDKLRSKPPAYEVYVTKKDLDTTATRWREEIKALDRRREEDNKEAHKLIGDKCNELERVLSDKIGDNKTNNSELMGQLRGELHAVRGTMQQLSNEIMHKLGILEGGKSRSSR